MMGEKIMTRHPEGKQGVNLDKQKYEQIRSAILATLSEEGGMRFKDLAPAVEKRVGPDFDGSIPWYVTTIKLDLEARGLIVRVPKTSPQRLRLSS